MVTFLTAIAAIGTIVGGIVYLVKTGVWAFKPNPDKENQNIDQEEKDNEKITEQTGRPQ